MNLGEREAVRFHCQYTKKQQDGKEHQIHLTKVTTQLLKVTKHWDHAKLIARAKGHKGPRSALPANVLVVLLDAVARDHYLRSLNNVQELLGEVEGRPLIDGLRFRAL